MTIYLTDLKKTVIATLRVWDNVHNDLAYAGSDLLREFVSGNDLHPGFDYDTDYSATSAEYRDFCEWWETETDAYNARSEHNWFVDDLSEDEREAEYAQSFDYLFDFDREDYCSGCPHFSDCPDKLEV